MADEITLSAYMAVVNKIDEKKTIATAKFTQTGVGVVTDVVTVPNASDLTLALGGVTTVGLAYFENLAAVADATHIINIGPDATGIANCIRLAPGQWCIVWLAAPPLARAAAGTPSLYYKIFQR